MGPDALGARQKYNPTAITAITTASHVWRASGSMLERVRKLTLSLSLVRLTEKFEVSTKFQFFFTDSGKRWEVTTL
jgi:hypothetical protein